MEILPTPKGTTFRITVCDDHHTCIGHDDTSPTSSGENR
jgi:hypothetical protein